MTNRRGRRRDATAAERKRRQLSREAQGRKPLTVEPRHDDFCEALQRFAAASENGDEPAVAKAVRMITHNEPGWEADREALSAVATAIIDVWAARWRRDQ